MPSRKLRGGEASAVNGFHSPSRSPYLEHEVSLEAESRANRRMISHLNIQIDYLQEKNQELERRLDESLRQNDMNRSQKEELDLTNRKLRDELIDVDRVAKGLEVDKENTIAIVDTELSQAKIELEHSRQELEGMDQVALGLKEDKQQLLTEIEILKTQIQSKEIDNSNLDELLERVQEDKKALTRRVTELSTNERALVLELERVKREKAGKKKPVKPSIKLERFIRGLEQDRDYWKGEVETLQQMFRARKGSRPSSPAPKNRSRTRSPKRKGETTPKHIMNGRRSASVHHDRASPGTNTLLQIAEDERDFYKAEYERLRNKRVKKRLSGSRHSSDADVIRLTDERDKLQGMLDRFEKHMSEIQTNVTLLTSERDKLQTLYDDTKEELQRCRRELLRPPVSSRGSIAAKSVLNRLENERDSAVTELHHVSVESEKMHDKLRIVTEKALEERSDFERQLDEMERRVNELELERDELTDRVTLQSRNLTNYEDKLADLDQKLISTERDRSYQKSEASQLKAVAQQAERSLDDEMRKLRGCEEQLRQVESEANRMRNTIDDCQSKERTNRDEIANLRSTISSLNGEKDELQRLLDDKNDQVLQLENTLLQSEKSVHNLRLGNAELESKLNQITKASDEDHQKIRSLRREMERSSAEINETVRDRDSRLRESQKLHDELSFITNEHHMMQEELENLYKERDELKDQAQKYLTEVKRFEEMLAGKEAERTELLKNYRQLSVEAEKFETHTHHLEKESSALKKDIVNKESELAQVQDKLKEFDSELSHHLHSQQEYEQQISDLTRSVANLEESLREAEDDRQRVMIEVDTFKKIVSQTDNDKDSLQRQLTKNSLDREKLQSLVDDLQHEIEILRSQVTSERASAKNLEQLLQTNRELELSAQLKSNERNSDIKLLQERLNLSESKLETVGREVSLMRARNADLDSETEQLRRQLTSERFEKERMASELRRQGLSPSRVEFSRGGSAVSRSFTSSRHFGAASRSPDRSLSPIRIDDQLSS